MRHGKVEILRLSQSSGQVEEKGRHAAFRTLADQQSMLLRPQKLVGCFHQQEVSNSAVLCSDRKQNTTFVIQDQRIGRRFDRQRVLLVGPTEQLSVEIKAEDAACAVLKRPTTANNPVHDQKDVFGGIGLADDQLVAAMTNRASPERSDAALNRRPLVARNGPGWNCGQGNLVKNPITRQCRWVHTAELGHSVPPNVIGLSNWI